MGKVKSWARKERWLNVTRLMSRDGGNCSICGLPLLRKQPLNSPNYITFDHIIPRSAGGLDKLSNLRLAHNQCNTERGNDPLEEIYEDG